MHNTLTNVCKYLNTNFPIFWALRKEKNCFIFLNYLSSIINLLFFQERNSSSLQNGKNKELSSRCSNKSLTFSESLSFTNSSSTSTPHPCNDSHNQISTLGTSSNRPSPANHSRPSKEKDQLPRAIHQGSGWQHLLLPWQGAVIHGNSTWLLDYCSEFSHALQVWTLL